MVNPLSPIRDKYYSASHLSSFGGIGAGGNGFGVGVRGGVGGGGGGVGSSDILQTMYMTEGRGISGVCGLGGGG